MRITSGAVGPPAGGRDSITGAPKLRSMEVIAEQEQEGRGFSFGSLGALDLRGRGFFNLLIRTLLWRSSPPGGADAADGEVTYRVGGGITWASDPALEDEESLLKGEALARALDQSPVIYLKETGHIPHIESPEAFADALRTALARIME